VKKKKRICFSEKKKKFLKKLAGETRRQLSRTP